MRLRSFQMVFAIPFLLFCATGARADTFHITIIDATFSATCIGGSGTCSEVVNGSADYDSVENAASNVSLQLTGTLSASFVWGSPLCGNPSLCLDLVNGGSGAVFYDPGVISGDNPIEFAPSLSPVFVFNAPTPEPLEGGNDGSALFIPGLCGGDQANCRLTGTFPTGADFSLTSGTYTSVDIGPSAPEPGSVTLLVFGVAAMGFLSRRLMRTESSK